MNCSAGKVLSATARDIAKDAVWHIDVDERDRVRMRYQRTAEEIEQRIVGLLTAHASGGWQPIEAWDLKKHGHHVIGWHPGGYGVAEYRFYEDGGWHVAAFNGMRIKRQPQKWQPLPRSPVFDSDDAAETSHESGSA